MAVSAADLGEWAREAFLDPHLVASVLLSFRRRRSRLDVDKAEADEKPSTSAPPPPTELPGWGRRIKRSRMMRLPRIIRATREEKDEEEEEDEDEEATAPVEKWKGKWRASPQSPLEGYSSASASGGEEVARATRPPVVAIAAPEARRTKGIANPRAPSVSSIPASGPIRRPSVKKMRQMKPQLKSVEWTLLLEKTKLLKEMEELRRAVEEIRAQNCKLQMQLESRKVPVNVHVILEDVDRLPRLCQPITPSYLPGREDFIAIPDLNDPLPGC